MGMKQSGGSFFFFLKYSLRAMLVYHKIEQTTQRFPIYPLPLPMHGFLHYERHSAECTFFFIYKG